MKPVHRSFLLVFLLTLTACGTFEVSLDRTPTPDFGSAIPTFVLQNQSGMSSATVKPAESRAKTDLHGAIYFWLSHSIPDPKDPYQQIDTGRIVRLPGSCVLVVVDCPAPEEVPVPFQIYSSSWQPLVWSPDGSMAALPVARGEGVAPMTIYLYQPSGESWTELENFPIVDSVSWSPGGEWITMRVQDGLGHVDIYVMRPDGSESRNLSAGLPDKGEPSFLSMSGWLAGKALVATRGSFDELTTFYQVDPETGETKLLFTYPTYPGGIYPASDNTLLAVGASSTQKQTLEIIHSDGTVAEALATFSKSGIYIVVWSHHEEKIAFTVQSEPYTVDDHRVFIINRDGSGLTELYRGIIIPSLIFSPDDRYLLFTDQERSLISISLETLEVQKIPIPIADSGQQILYPSWRP